MVIHQAHNLTGLEPKDTLVHPNRIQLALLNILEYCSVSKSENIADL